MFEGVGDSAVRSSLPRGLHVRSSHVRREHWHYLPIGVEHCPRTTPPLRRSRLVDQLSRTSTAARRRQGFVPLVGAASVAYPSADIDGLGQGLHNAWNVEREVAIRAQLVSVLPLPGSGTNHRATLEPQQRPGQAAQVRLGPHPMVASTRWHPISHDPSGKWTVVDLHPGGRPRRNSGNSRPPAARSRSRPWSQDVGCHQLWRVLRPVIRESTRDRALQRLAAASGGYRKGVEPP